LHKWLGPSLFSALAVGAVVRRAAGLSATAGDILSLALLLGGVGWALRSPEKLRSLSSLYLWLAFILLLDDPAHWLPAVAGRDRALLYEIASGAHLLVVLMAASALGAWTKESPARPAAGLFIAGAVIFWWRR
jgi:hypothetical protein